MEYCQTCRGKKEVMGLGLITQTCSTCLGSGLKKASEICLNVEPKKRRKKTEKTYLANSLNEHNSERIDKESNPILPGFSDSAA